MSGVLGSEKISEISMIWFFADSTVLINANLMFFAVEVVMDDRFAKQDQDAPN